MTDFIALLYDEGQVIEQNDIQTLTPSLKEGNFLWVDAEVGVKGLDDLIHRFSGGEHASEIYTALTANDTRPRYDDYGDIGLVILRGVNLNPDSDPEDMISVRILVGKNFAITVRRRHLIAINDTRGKLAAYDKPVSGGHFVFVLGNALMERMQGTLFTIDEKIDDLEEQVLKGGDMEAVRKDLVDTRFIILALRRYVVPQKEIFSALITAAPSWTTKAQAAGFRNVADTVGRYGDALDMARERCSILFEEVKTHLSERVNQNTYLLSIITAIFLPLGILTGLFGVNVGGMPGINSPYAFGILSGCLVLLGVITGFFLKRKDWF